VVEVAARGTWAGRVRKLRAQGWQPDAPDVLRMARPLAHALEAIHAAQLVHRDLSPGNLLLATEPTAVDNGSAAQLVGVDERLLLSDLGMCKDLAINSGLTVSGGTAGFRPPEQSQPGMVDTRADIWAASALLSWVAEGANLPEDFHRVLQRGMETDPSHRHQTIIEWLTEGEAAPAPPQPEIQAPATPQLQHQTKRNPTSQREALPDFIPTPASGQPLRTATLVLIGVAVVTGIIGLVAGMFFGDDHYPSEIDDASIAISGPEEVTVGEAATFEAETEGEIGRAHV